MVTRPNNPTVSKSVRNKQALTYFNAIIHHWSFKRADLLNVGLLGCVTIGYCDFFCPGRNQNSVNTMKAQGVNSIEINVGLEIGPKPGPRFQIEKCQIGRWRPASPLGRTGPSFCLKTGPKTDPIFFRPIELTPALEGPSDGRTSKKRLRWVEAEREKRPSSHYFRATNLRWWVFCASPRNPITIIIIQNSIFVPFFITPFWAWRGWWQVWWWSTPNSAYMDFGYMYFSLIWTILFQYFVYMAFFMDFHLYGPF